jgi:hypothetical protein
VYKENTKYLKHKAKGGQVMKPKLIIITLIALIASACSSSLQMTSKYVDDNYYWPSDAITEVIVEKNPSPAQKEELSKKDLIIISELGEKTDGTKTMNNYIYADDEPDWYNQVQAENLNNLNLEGTDTVYISDENETSYEINNYYIDDEDSYSSRIRRFYDPFYYDNDFYWGPSWGYYPYHNNWSYSYFDPFYYNSWYSPWGYSSLYYNPWSYGSYYGCYGYNNWNYPYYGYG